MGCPLFWLTETSILVWHIDTDEMRKSRYHWWRKVDPEILHTSGLKGV
jgi:hypothetical protein